MNNKNNLITVGFCLTVAVTMTGCDLVDSAKGYFSKDKSVQAPAAEKNTSKINMNRPLANDELARVGDWRITSEEFTDRLKALKEVIPDFDETTDESRKLVLDELIRQQLVVADAKKTGLSNSTEIKAAIEEFERTLIVREVAAKITGDITVTDEEINQFYVENKEALIEPIQMKVRTIVLDTQPKANELLIQILQGTDFVEIAKQNSIAENAAEGGDLGWISDVPFAEMANAIIPLAAGDVSSVFRGPDGFYIVKVEDKKGGEQIPLENVEEDIRQNRLIFKQQKKIVEYIENLRTQHTVEVNETLLLK
jgi:peptidyl-prolyl cis-trans isomerase C